MQNLFSFIESWIVSWNGSKIIEFISSRPVPSSHRLQRWLSLLLKVRGNITKQFASEVKISIFTTPVQDIPPANRNLNNNILEQWVALDVKWWWTWRMMDGRTDLWNRITIKCHVTKNEEEEVDDMASREWFWNSYY